MSEFLPEGYTVPDNNNYFKFKEGENTFRIMSSAIIGYEYWTNDKKPVRSKDHFESTPNIKLDKDGKPTKVKHFWAFVVWNYKSNSIQILQVTQSSIQGAIKALVDNEKWGTPMGYDITVTRVGDGLDTEYSTMPNPHLEVAEEIKTAHRTKKVNIEALYDGEDPFEGDKEKTADPADIGF